MGGKTLTKANIVKAIYEKSNQTRAEVKEVVEDLLRVMKQAIKNENALLISGFGKFEVYDKQHRKGRNPQTGDTLTLPPRCAIVFRVSKVFRAKLKDGTHVTQD